MLPKINFYIGEDIAFTYNVFNTIETTTETDPFLVMTGHAVPDGSSDRYSVTLENLNGIFPEFEIHMLSLSAALRTKQRVALEIVTREGIVVKVKELTYVNYYMAFLQGNIVETCDMR